VLLLAFPHEAYSRQPRPQGGVNCAQQFATGIGSGYTQGMKTAISLPDDTFKKAEKLARRLKKSRSQLYREAVEDYIARHDEDEITESWNRALAESGEDDPEEARFVQEVARRTLERSEW
jgi:predicted transcriptional regulator